MNKFKIGDRVKLLAKYVNSEFFGIGTIVEYGINDSTCYVLWDIGFIRNNQLFCDESLTLVLPVAYLDFQDKIKDRLSS